MALNIFLASLHPNPSSSSSSTSPPSNQRHRLFLQLYPHPSSATRVRSEQSESGVTDSDDPSSSFSGSLSSSRTQLDLLDGYLSDGIGGSRNLSIRDQLAQLVAERDDNFTIPLGKNLKKLSPKFLTVSQKRNIKRQSYLNEVSQRNDSVFFATIGAFVILPPFVILGIAVLTGYVQLFP
ncbi:PREDICTED: uncharacterized protein LOC104803370 [Tarenaya hassleriana]|uniref:uncharacterized protein LOC104803370 n=1 Tax=Tarenaya hassleriana TaxID=28532 RepID=UPI00053C9451|nr:PREDICTED: uncharacterized protein LOC104803370 [Tarenaya hassleriana]